MRTLHHNWLMKVKCSRIKSFDDCKEISVANRFLLAYKWQVFNTLRNMGSEIKIHLSVGVAVVVVFFLPIFPCTPMCVLFLLLCNMLNALWLFHNVERLIFFGLSLRQRALTYPSLWTRSSHPLEIYRTSKSFSSSCQNESRHQFHKSPFSTQCRLHVLMRQQNPIDKWKMGDRDLRKTNCQKL